MAREYANAFTLDGRLRPGLGVTKGKVKAVRELLEGHLGGDPRATGVLTEALTTSDAIFNLAHLTNLNFVPNFDEAPREWKQLAGERRVNDLRPATLYSLNLGWTDGNGDSQVLGEHGEAPVIPEGTAYPYAYISGQVAEGASVKKRGLKTDWTLESRINDGLGALDDLPGQLNDVSLDTEQADVLGALTTQTTAASALDGGLIPTGETVLPNAAFSQQALIRAVIELSERKINGKNIQVTGGYNLVVPIGQALFVKFALNMAYTQTAPTPGAGAYVMSVNGFDPLAGIDVVESSWVSGNSWILLPKPGATRRPVLEHLTLRGYETPQLMVDNHTGNFIGGATVSPFEGSFAADVITLKLRQFGGGVVWDGGLAIVTSNGTGTA